MGKKKNGLAPCPAPKVAAVLLGITDQRVRSAVFDLCQTNGDWRGMGIKNKIREKLAMANTSSGGRRSRQPRCLPSAPTVFAVVVLSRPSAPAMAGSADVRLPGGFVSCHAHKAEWASTGHALGCVAPVNLLG